MFAEEEGLSDILTRVISIPRLAMIDRDPETNFEELWQTFFNRYPFFETRNVDWKDQYDRYRPKVTTARCDLNAISIVLNESVVHEQGGVALACPCIYPGSAESEDVAVFDVQGATSLMSQNINSPVARAANIPFPWAGFNGPVIQALKHAKVKTALSLSKKIPSGAVTVDSDNDVVTLRGEVPNDEVRNLAEQIARDVPGVREVHNHLYAIAHSQ